LLPPAHADAGVGLGLGGEDLGHVGRIGGIVDDAQLPVRVQLVAHGGDGLL